MTDHPLLPRDAAPRPAAAAPFAGAGAALLAGYAVLYVLLEWISFIRPMSGTDITPWNPQLTLAVAMLARAPRMRWTAVVTVLAAAVGPTLRHAAGIEAAAASAQVLGDLVAAAGLRRALGRAQAIATRKDYGLFMLAVALGAAAQSASYAVVIALPGPAAPDTLREALVVGWISDAVSLIVGLPLVFALVDRARRARLVAVLRMLEWWLIAAVAIAVTYTVFVRGSGDEFKHFYLLFLPIGWAAARFGSSGAIASSTLVQLLLIMAVQSLSYEPRTVFELHLLMAALGATALLVGTTLDEREAAEEALRASLRAAAAADMAAALAHELNQPLTSVVGYARATQLLVERLEASADPALGPALAPVIDVSRKLAREALRAGDVVKRLRAFFQQQDARPEVADIRPLIDDVVRAHVGRARRAGIALDAPAHAPLPPLPFDRVQIEVVLRNLVANALDAALSGHAREAAATGAGAEAAPVPRVRVQAAVRADALVVEVHDSGTGVAPDEIARLFETRRSAKPGGMGIGLAISRAIVEAHFGRLWAEPGPGGRFFFSLPLRSGSSETSD